MTPITFSDQRPTEKGLYLYRETPESRPLLMEAILSKDGVSISRINGHRRYHVSRYAGQWSGKLEFNL